MTTALRPPPSFVDPASTGTFYVPAFEVRIRPPGAQQGTELPADVVRDISEVTYKDSISEIDGCEFKVNNWDAAKRTFRYTGSEGLFPNDAELTRRQQYFQPGNELELWLGYVGAMRLMMRAQITTAEPDFPSSGNSVLSVRALNVLHQLRKKKFTDYWPRDNSPGIKDSKVAESFNTAVDEQGRKRFPLPVKVRSLPDEPERTRVFQKDEYDIVFLLSLARRNGYVVSVRETDEQGRPDKRHLYFGPSDESQENAGGVRYRLEWGKTLIQFRPTLTTARQVSSVTVHGWNRRTKKAIKVTVDFKDKTLGINRDLGDIEQAFQQNEEIIADRPVSSEAEAKALARETLRNRLKDMIKGSGSTIGLPGLRSGGTLFIGGLGNRFSGTYFVTETTHTIGEGGYTTSFSARREQEDS